MQKENQVINYLSPIEALRLFSSMVVEKSSNQLLSHRGIETILKHGCQGGLASKRLAIGKARQQLGGSIKS